MNYLLEGMRDFYLDESGITVVEYVVGAALLLGAMTVFFVGWEEGLSSAIASAVQGIYD